MKLMPTQRRNGGLTNNEIKKLEEFLNDREIMNVDDLSKKWEFSAMYVHYVEYVLRKIGIDLPRRKAGRPYKEKKGK